jgi:cytidylate kinase
MYYGVVYKEDRHYDLVVDTTERTIDEVVGVIIREVEQHRAGEESH